MEWKAGERRLVNRRLVWAISRAVHCLPTREYVDKNRANLVQVGRKREGRTGTGRKRERKIPSEPGGMQRLQLAGASAGWIGELFFVCLRVSGGKQSAET